MGATVTPGLADHVFPGHSYTYWSFHGWEQGWGGSAGGGVLTAPRDTLPRPRLPLKGSLSLPSAFYSRQALLSVWGRVPVGARELTRVTANGGPAKTHLRPFFFLGEGNLSLSLWPQPQLLHLCPPHRSTSPWAPSSVSGEKSAGLLGAFRGTDFGLFSLYSKPHYKGALALGFLC